MLVFVETQNIVHEGCALQNPDSSMFVLFKKVKKGSQDDPHLRKVSHCMYSNFASLYVLITSQIDKIMCFYSASPLPKLCTLGRYSCLFM